MNTGELLQILHQAQAMGLTTFGQLAQLFADVDAVTNREKVNFINRLFVNF